MSATAAILDFAAAAHTLPARARADAVRLLGDTLAGGAAGASSPEGQALLGTVAGWGEGRQSRLLCGVIAPAASAAFFNGFAIHCLEWDAVHEGAVVHAMSVVTAALLASSDGRGGSDPDDFLTALAIGVDIASGLGIAATGPMQFFRPATAGIIGAALAVARLEGLPREQFGDVLGLAYSFASGTMQAHVEASVALPLQIANAARSAIMAVDLAKAGMDGPHDALEGPFGYAALVEPSDLALYTAELGSNWRISEVAIKPFPSGRASHGALGALQAMRDDDRVALEQVVSIELRAPPLIHRLVARPYKPGMSPAYARLCLAILGPLMLRDGVIDPNLFGLGEGAGALHDPALVRLAQNTTIKLVSNANGNAMAPQYLTVKLNDGRTIIRDIPAILGSIATPMSAAQSTQKYNLCRRLAGEQTDRRIFDNPLAYATEPA